MDGHTQRLIDGWVDGETNEEEIMQPIGEDIRLIWLPVLYTRATNECCMWS